jgi:hypothetical protein
METDREVRDHSPRNPASIYRVYVAGTIPSGWETRLGSLQIVREGGHGSSDQTLLMGAVRDQAELLGILNTLHELRLPLLLVEAVDTDLCPCQAKNAKKRMERKEK